MSFLPGAAANIAATTTTSLFSKIWDHSAGYANYLIKFTDNHESLANKMVELRNIRDHVKRRIQLDEASGMECTPVVAGWLRRVEAIEHEVDLILQASAQQLEQTCVGGCCLQNWWTCYQLGKKTCKKLRQVVDLIGKGNFNIVVDKSLPRAVQVRQESPSVGMDALFDKVRKLLRQDEVKMIGIYGMGGVGKTLLLKRIDNSFRDMGENGMFDVVLWVVVSKEFNMTRVQKQIGDRLGLAWSKGDDETTKALRIFNVLSLKKFVVMFDDIWQHIELEAIGIPSPHSCNYNSKVVFTTGSESVCGYMEVDQKVRVDVLERDHAWILFQQKVGREALNSHPEIPKMAEELVTECRGLPLAIITIGRAMASKKTPQEWKHALKTLNKYASEFSGMEDKVLATLKFSYDSLENDTARMCFLYCSLYPEDKLLYKDKIVGLWSGEGFLDEFEDLEDARDKGHDIIGNLKAACLLENGRVFKEKMLVMHDIVRDLALWIARECGKKKNKYLVEAGVGLAHAPNLECWKDAQRISLMENRITELPKPPHCPYLLTLMLQKNPLSSMSTEFFQYMPCLRVLNLSHADITNLPVSIGNLFELRFLDLSNTKIQTLPNEMKNLTKLIMLDLSVTEYLCNIPSKMISHFSRLQRLDFSQSGLKWDGSICYPGSGELECLADLRGLGITVQNFETLESICLSHRLSSCIYHICVCKCHGMLQLTPSLLLGNMKKIQQLTIQACSELEEVTLDCSKENKDNTGLLPTLEALHFRHLPKLNIVWTGEKSMHLHFKNLFMVEVVSCDALKDVSWLALVPALGYLKIENCEKLEEILANVFSCTTTENKTTFARLETLILEGLPKLKTISRVALPFSSLKRMTVTGCPLLKKLPFTSTSTSKPLLAIHGDTERWDELQWEKETSQSFIQNFMPIL